MPDPKNMNLRLFDLAGIISFDADRAQENAEKMLALAIALQKESDRALDLANQFAYTAQLLERAKAREE